MDIKPKKGTNPIRVVLQSTDFSLENHDILEIPAVLENVGDIDDYFTVSLIGVPAEWVSLPDPSPIWLPHMENKTISLEIHPVLQTERNVGLYPARLRVTSQSRPGISLDVEINLTILLSSKKGKILLQPNQEHIDTTPGESTPIHFSLKNDSPQEGYYEFSWQGIPDNWISLPTPVYFLKAEEQTQVTLTVEIPTSIPVQAGSYTFSVKVVKQGAPDNFAEALLTLYVATYIVGGRIGVLVDATQIAIMPGEAATMKLTLINQGLDADIFAINVEGIPLNWVSATSPVTALNPGERKEVSIAIHPPRDPQTHAGRRPFKVRIISRTTPDQIADISGILTISAYVDFQVTLDKTHQNTGETARVTVTNLGNLQSSFALFWFSQSDALSFDLIQTPTARGAGGQTPHLPILQPPSQPGEPLLLRIPPGTSYTVSYKARLKKLPVLQFNGPVLYPYHISVSADYQNVQQINGEVTAKSLIPIWLLPLILLLCLCVMSLAVIYLWTEKPLASSRETNTPVDKTAVAINSTQTAAHIQTEAVKIGIQGLTRTAAAWTHTPKPAQKLSSTPINFPTPTRTNIPSYSATPTKIPTSSNPVPSQLPGQIVWSSNRAGGNLQLYTSNQPVADNPTQLSNDSATNIQAVWSHDFSKITYTSNINGNNDIYVMNADGSNKINVTNNPANDQYPTWSPDGAYIAFTSDRSGNDDIFVMKADGSEVVNISNNPASETMPSWGKGGALGMASVIAFVSNRDGNNEIYSMKSNGTSILRLTNNPGNDFTPNISAMGNMITFTSDRSGNMDIFTMKYNGTNQVDLTNNPAVDTYSTWSPDGQWIAFTSNRDGNPEIYIMKADGSGVYNYTNQPTQDIYPGW